MWLTSKVDCPCCHWHNRTTDCGLMGKQRPNFEDISAMMETWLIDIEQGTTFILILTRRFLSCFVVGPLLGN